MSDTPNSWFHCGHCGSLFRSPAGDAESRVCPECGLDPSLGVEPVPVEQPAPIVPADTSQRPREPEKSSRKKRRGSHLIFKLIAIWMLLLVGIVVGAGYLFKKAPAGEKSAAAEPVNTGPTPEEAALLTEGGPLASQGFFGFLAAGTPEARNQFVLNPITTASRMARFYDLNPIVTIAPETLTLLKSAVLHLPAGRAIETLWNTADGRQIDAVFVEQDNEWRLDWDHFVRFSTYPWALFLAGSGEPEGEFRLLARQRLAEERKDAEDVSIVLYVPRFGFVNETGFQSPEFLVKRDTRNGRLLDAAFELEQSGKRVFGLDLPHDNPEGLIRVRVKVRRIKDDMGSRFELVDVLACHWYSTDDPGVEIQVSEPEK